MVKYCPDCGTTPLVGYNRRCNDCKKVHQSASRKAWVAKRDKHVEAGTVAPCRYCDAETHQTTHHCAEVPDTCSNEGCLNTIPCNARQNAVTCGLANCNKEWKAQRDVQNRKKKRAEGKGPNFNPHNAKPMEFQQDIPEANSGNSVRTLRPRVADSDDRSHPIQSDDPPWLTPLPAEPPRRNSPSYQEYLPENIPNIPSPNTSSPDPYAPNSSRLGYPPTPLLGQPSNTYSISHSIAEPPFVPDIELPGYEDEDLYGTPGMTAPNAFSSFASMQTSLPEITPSIGSTAPPAGYMDYGAGESNRRRPRESDSPQDYYSMGHSSKKKKHNSRK